MYCVPDGVQLLPTYFRSSIDINTLHAVAAAGAHAEQAALGGFDLDATYEAPYLDYDNDRLIVATDRRGSSSQHTLFSIDLILVLHPHHSPDFRWDSMLALARDLIDGSLEIVRILLVNEVKVISTEKDKSEVTLASFLWTAFMTLITALQDPTQKYFGMNFSASKSWF